MTVNASNIFFYFRSFLNCLQLESFDTKGIDIGDACLNCIYAKISCFKRTYIKSAYAKNAYIENAFVKSANTDDAYIAGTYVKRTSTNSTWAKDVDTKSTDTESTLIRSIYSRGTCLGGVSTKISTYSSSNCIKAGIYISSACINNVSIDVIGIAGTCAGRACTGSAFIGSIYMKSVNTKDTYMKGASRKSACIGSANIVKYLKIHLQSFFYFESRAD